MNKITVCILNKHWELNLEEKWLLQNHGQGKWEIGRNKCSSQIIGSLPESDKQAYSASSFIAFL